MENKDNKNLTTRVFYIKGLTGVTDMYIVSEKNLDSLFGDITILSLYVGVVYGLARLIHGCFLGRYYKLIYDSIPNPNPLLRLCAGVIIARHENELEKEAELYFELVEALRSTELLRLITKTSKDVLPFKEKNKNVQEDEEVKEDDYEEEKKLIFIEDQKEVHATEEKEEHNAWTNKSKQ